jgi:hypothetical protein
MTDLFGGLLSYRTADGRTIEAKPRGKHYIEPRGYAAKPGTGPEGESCKSCRHSIHAGTGGKRFPKCELMLACWTSSRRTDILMGAAACSKWERDEG